MKKYCKKCGSRLIKKELGYMPWYMKIIGGKPFNPYSGEKNAVISTYCPNIKWYNFGHYSDITYDRY